MILKKLASGGHRKKGEKTMKTITTRYGTIIYGEVCMLHTKEKAIALYSCYHGKKGYSYYIINK